MRSPFRIMVLCQLLRAVRGPSEPVNTDRANMIRQHCERAGSRTTKKIRGSTVGAQTERWDEVRGWSLVDHQANEGRPTRNANAFRSWS